MDKLTLTDQSIRHLFNQITALESEKQKLKGEVERLKGVLTFIHNFLCDDIKDSSEDIQKRIEQALKGGE